jgi:integrase
MSPTNIEGRFLMKRRSNNEGTIFQEKSGLWVAEISLENGKRKRKRSKVQKVVKEWLLSQRDAVRDGTVIENDKVTFSDFLDRYIDDIASHTLRPKTLEAYRYLIRMHIKPTLGNIRLVQLRPEHIQTLYSQKLSTGLSRRTVQFMHSVIHKSLEQAARWSMVVRNVSDLVDPPTVIHKAPDTLSPEQVNLFLDQVKSSRFYPMYCLAFVGLREGEILGLHIEDFDRTNGTIRITHAVQYLVGKGLVITEPKTEKARRSLKLPDFVYKALVKHVEQQNRNQGLMFVTTNGTPFSPRNFFRDYKEQLESAGLPDIRFHDLRHTTATLLLSQNVHPRVVQEMLGHSQIGITMDTYSHVLPIMQEEASNKIDTLLKERNLVKIQP